MVAQGRVPITKFDMKPSRTTLSNYSAVLANTDGVSICITVISKSRTRYTAENSLISAMALICVVVATHFDISSDVSMDINNKVIKTASKGVQMLFNMVTKFYGKTVPILAVIPEYVFSTDNTVQFIHEGKGDTKDVFRLVGSNSIKTSGTRSKYKFDDCKNMNGLRVKLTYTFTSIGTMAPIFISVLVLNERELP